MSTKTNHRLAADTTDKYGSAMFLAGLFAGLLAALSMAAFKTILAPPFWAAPFAESLALQVAYAAVALLLGLFFVCVAVGLNPRQFSE